MSDGTDINPAEPPVNTAPLSAQEIESLFGAVPPPPPHTYELALALGGTVSAGAYTAGVLDFLIQALDAWTQRRDAKDPAAPTHHVVLKVAAGTSGGGVNAAIAARALAWDFPPMPKAAMPTLEGGVPVTAIPINPFYHVWVDLLRLDGFLKTTDLEGGGHALSLLNGGPIDAGATYVAGFQSLARRARSYVAEDGLRVVLTVTNLRGVAYQTRFDGGLTQTYIDHADHMRYRVVYNDAAPPPPRPDEQVLGFAPGAVTWSQAVTWSTFSVVARATAAFPIGFPARDLTRPTVHYRYRVDVVPGAEGQGALASRVPDWAALAGPDGRVPEEYAFCAVDGGATDNEPIGLARAVLAGVINHSPRDPAKAMRGVLLVDPFAGVADLGPASGAPLRSMIGPLLSTFTQQTRYDSEDLLLAADEDVYSRFMITPQRDGKVGGAAIASNGLGAFIGFASAAFSRHDFLLGRRNCQDYLRSSLVLAEENPIFEQWTPQQKDAFRVVRNGRSFLPLIPLLGPVAQPEQTDSWPQGVLDPQTCHDGIDQRVAALVKAELTGGLLTSVLSWLGSGWAGDAAADAVVDALRQSLQETGLA